MAKRNVENAANDQYEKLKLNVPTEKEMRARRAFRRKVEQMQAGKGRKPPQRVNPSTEEMQREDRER